MFASAISFLQFPIGLALGVYTFQVLLGRRHATMYGELENGAALGLR